MHPVLQESGHEHVAVQPSQHHGRGLFARRAFAPGEVGGRACGVSSSVKGPRLNPNPRMDRSIDRPTDTCTWLQVILRERPLVALQSLDNRQYVPCCGGCFHFLGSARHHLMVRVRTTKPRASWRGVPQPPVSLSIDKPPTFGTFPHGLILCCDSCWRRPWTGPRWAAPRRQRRRRRRPRSSPRHPSRPSCPAPWCVRRPTWRGYIALAC